MLGSYTRVFTVIHPKLVKHDLLPIERLVFYLSGEVYWSHSQGYDTGHSLFSLFG